MAVVIRMMRAGAKKRPFYRVVAADSRRQRDGRFLEILGHYDPIAKPMDLKLDKDKVLAWLAKGAQPSQQAASLFRMQGIVVVKQAKPPKAEAAGAAKEVVKRAKPREKTERRTLAKAARVKKRAKIAAKAQAPKEKKKKS